MTESDNDVALLMNSSVSVSRISIKNSQKHAIIYKKSGGKKHENIPVV
jgi:hypothetical protein